MMINSQMMSSISFFIPKKYVVALSETAADNGVGLNVYLSEILAREFSNEKIKYCFLS